MTPDRRVSNSSTNNTPKRQSESKPGRDISNLRSVKGETQRPRSAPRSQVTHNVPEKKDSTSRSNDLLKRVNLKNTEFHKQGKE
jgi:hypothetical protein